MLAKKGLTALFDPAKMSGMLDGFKGSEKADLASSSTKFFFPSGIKPIPAEFWKGAKRPLPEREDRFAPRLGIPVAKFTVGKGLGFSPFELSEPLFWAGLI